MTHTPPPDLPPEAAAKWAEIVGNHDADALTPLDLDAIRDYCLAHAEEQAALKLLGACPNPFVLDADGKLVINPLRAIVKQARAEMQRLRRELRSKLPSAAGWIDDYKRRLLVEIQRRHLHLVDPDVEPGPGWKDQVEYGPLFSAVQWFDCAEDDAERMRWTRAMSALIDEALVIENREDGAKWSNVRLSDGGEKTVADLAAHGDQGTLP